MVQSLKFCLNQKVFWVYTFLAILALLKQITNEAILIDSHEYLKKAEHLIQNWNFENVPQDRMLEPIRRTLGYPLILKILNNSHVLLLIFQLFISLSIPLILYRLIQHFNLFLRLWFYSMIALLTYPLQFFYTGFIMPEIIVQATLLTWILFYFEGHWKRLPFLLTCLILLKPVFIILMLLPVVLYLFKRYQPTLFDILPIATYLVICGLHLKQYNVFEYSSVGYTNAYDYNRKKYLLQKIQNDSLVEAQYNQEYERNIQKNKQNWPFIIQYLKSESTPILKDPVYWMIHFKGVFATILDPGRYDAMVFFNWSRTQGFMGVNDGNENKNRTFFEWFYIVLFLFLSVVKLLFAFIAIIHWRRYFVFAFFAALILIFAFMAGPVGSARYLLPFYPLMSFLSAVGFATILEKRAL